MRIEETELRRGSQPGGYREGPGGEVMEVKYRVQLSGKEIGAAMIRYAQQHTGLDMPASADRFDVTLYTDQSGGHIEWTEKKGPEVK